MNDIFRQIAKENGTTEKAVKEEMQFAIRKAMKSDEPEAMAFWNAVAPDEMCIRDSHRGLRIF